MITKMKIILICGSIITSQAGAPGGVASSLQQFQRFLATPEARMGTAKTWPGYAELVAAGPNAIPALLRAVEEAVEEPVRMGLCNVIQTVAWLKPYYPRGNAWSGAVAAEDEGHPLPPSWHAPPAASAQGAMAMSERTLAWWERARDAEAFEEDYARFLSLRKDLDAEGRSGERYYTLLRKHVLTYGIFSLPVCLELVATENDAVVFMHLLQMCRMDLFRALDPQPGVAGTAEKIARQYPGPQDKWEVLCAWWEENKRTFTELTELHARIEARMAHFCAE